MLVMVYCENMLLYVYYILVVVYTSSSVYYQYMLYGAVILRGMQLLSVLTAKKFYQLSFYIKCMFYLSFSSQPVLLTE